MSLYYQPRTIVANGDDGSAYTITIWDDADEWLAYGADSPALARCIKELVCHEGPVIRVDQGVYEIWVAATDGPQKVLARCDDPSAP